MYKIFFTLIFVASLNAQMIDAIAIVVKGKAITLYDIKQEMKLSHTDEKKASDILIRKKLEEIEVVERKITVSSSEVYDDIKETASRNNMSISEFYEAVRNSNGLSSSELKVKIKEKLLSQKLYSAIAYSSMSQPSENEIKEYYELHKERFNHPKSFDVIIYGSQNQQSLQAKITNPMLYTPDVVENKQILPYDRIPPELSSLLLNTEKNSFSKIVPNGKGGFMSFYLKNIDNTAENSIESVKEQIINIIMGDAREQVLSDYFARLKDNADIDMIRGLD